MRRWSHIAGTRKTLVQVREYTEAGACVRYWNERTDGTWDLFERIPPETERISEDKETG